MTIRQPYPKELYHHGIKGQKWGIRRFQNSDGTLTTAGKKRYETGTVQKAGGIPNNIGTDLNEKKQAAINSGNIKEVRKMASTFSPEEYRQAIQKIEMNQRLDQLASQARTRKGQEIVDGMLKTKTALQTVSSIYDTVAEVNNALNPGHSLPRISASERRSEEKHAAEMEKLHAEKQSAKIKAAKDRYSFETSDAGKAYKQAAKKKAEKEEAAKKEKEEEEELENMLNTGLNKRHDQYTDDERKKMIDAANRESNRITNISEGLRVAQKYGDDKVSEQLEKGYEAANARNQITSAIYDKELTGRSRAERLSSNVAKKSDMRKNEKKTEKEENKRAKQLTKDFKKNDVYKKAVSKSANELDALSDLGEKYFKADYEIQQAKSRANQEISRVDVNSLSPLAQKLFYKLYSSRTPGLSHGGAYMRKNYPAIIRQPYPNELYHHGIKGQKWGVRRFQNSDGTLTTAGKKRYETGTVQKAGKAKNPEWESLNRKDKKEVNRLANKVTDTVKDEYFKKSRENGTAKEAAEAYQKWEQVSRDFVKKVHSEGRKAAKSELHAAKADYEKKRDKYFEEEMKEVLKNLEPFPDKIKNDKRRNNIKFYLFGGGDLPIDIKYGRDGTIKKIVNQTVVY